MSDMLPVVVLVIILLVAGYVVYRSMVEERHGKTAGAGSDRGADAADDRGDPGAQPPADPRPARPRSPDGPDSGKGGAGGSGRVTTGPGAGDEIPDAASGARAGSTDSGDDSTGVPGLPQRARGRPRRRRATPDPALAEHVGKLREAVDSELISADEAVASLVRSSGGTLDEGGARAMLASAPPRPAPNSTSRDSTSRGSTSG